MLNTPKFKTYFRVETIESVGVFLLAESDYVVLTGRLYELLAPLIDGRHTVDEIADLLQEKASAAEVYYTLMLMEQKGYIVENDDSLPPEVAAFWDILNVDLKLVKSRLQSTKVAVTSFGAVPTKPFIDILESLNVQVAEEGDIAVVLTDDYLQPDIDIFNQKALQSQRPWMLVKPVGKIIWLGPIFYPDKTACWDCLAHRLRSNRPVETFIQTQKGISTPFSTSVGILPSTLQTGLNLAATELAKWIVRGENKRLEGSMVTFDTLSLKSDNHIAIKRPQCASCGEPKYLDNTEPSPIVLQSRQKNFTEDGGHRYLSPEATLKKYEQHISPITGTVRALRPMSQMNNGLTNIYVAGHNFATMFDSLYFLRENIRGRSGGKGKTDIQAKASAFCEAIERYSGVFQGYEIRQTGSYQQMGAKAIHPNECMNFSEAQYKTRHEWNASADCTSLFQKVPEPFEEEVEIEWTPLWSLTAKEFKYLPTAYCYYGYQNLSKPYCWANSNGTAAGNNIEEAILQGFMELVERDAVALWWYNRVQRPVVDLATFDDPYLQNLKDYYQTINRDLWVLDITSDFNIPVFAAISRRTDREVEDIVFGFGAHLDAKIAILRAVTEANQILPAVLSVASDGSTQYKSSDDLALKWWKTATLKNQPYLAPDTSVSPRTYFDYPRLGSDDLLEDVNICVQLAEKAGLETLVLDQTRPDIGLNVVKVIVPGMRHFWKRLAAGRLYDVPVKLGWLPTALKEEELNPIPIFF